MDRLSIYELLSFIMPGALVVELINFCSSQLLNYHTIFTVQNLGEGMVFLFLALFFGSLIHIISFKYLLSRKWYKIMVYKPIDKIKNCDYIEKIYPTLKEMYVKIANKKKTEVSKGEIFDFAYYYLESQDKITQAKNFQSLYFLFRNIFNLGFIACVFLIIIGILSFCKCFNGNMPEILYSLLVVIITTLISAFIARWFRVKMADRIFGTYYADLIYNRKTDKNK